MLVDWQQYLGPFTVLTLIAVGVWEMRQPLSAFQVPVARRWALHFGLWVGVSLFLNFVLRISAIGLAASLGGQTGFLPFFLVQDFALWCSHWGMHRFGVLWVWHSIHHSDPDMDASTGLRFHPIEGLWDQSVMLGLVWLLQPSVDAVVGLQFLGIASNYFVHANVALPMRMESMLQWVLMTPGLHRPHHSIEMAGQKGNYGIVLSVWDRMFGTLHRRSFGSALGIEGVPVEETLKPLYVLGKLPWREWKRL